MGLSWNATQLIIPVSFVEPVAREHNWNPAVLTDSAHTAEGEWTTADWSSWLNDTKTRTWNALGKDRHQWKLNRRQVHPRLWAVSLFSQSVERHARDMRDLARDWRPENASLVSRVCSTLPRAFTPLTKSEEKESLANPPQSPPSLPTHFHTLPTPPPFPFHGIETFYIYRQNLPAFCNCFVLFVLFKNTSQRLEALKDTYAHQSLTSKHHKTASTLANQNLWRTLDF